MSYEQLLPFYPKEMGTQKGWCLKNVRLGYRINTGKYASAKKAMEAGKLNGTFHTGNPSTNVSVPVYTTSPSPNGHVVECDRGQYYTDGRKYNPARSDIIGWDEMCDGRRVVKVSSVGFLPAKGYWGRYDKDERVGTLARFMRATFPSYTPSSALGNIYGDNLWRSIAEFQRRAKADGNYVGAGATIDGNTGILTYNALKKYGFKG